MHQYTTQSLSMMNVKNNMSAYYKYDYFSFPLILVPSRNSHRSKRTLNSRERVYLLAWQGTGEGEGEKKKKEREEKKKAKGNFRKWRWKLASIGIREIVAAARVATRVPTTRPVYFRHTAHASGHVRARKCRAFKRVQIWFPLSPIALEWPCPLRLPA